MNWAYLKYLLRHKWFTFKACRIIGVPFFQALLHDLSKFRPDEWGPYRDFFYGNYPESPAYGTPTGKEVKLAFDKAWLLHLHRNPHHWQHWVLINDTDGTYPLDMPNKYVREMVADWLSFGLSKGEPNELGKWYDQHKDGIVLSRRTRLIVEFLVNTYGRRNGPAL